MKTKTEIFIDKVKAKNHANHIDSNGNYIYDYSKVVYTGSHEKITIVCSIHGDFEQSASKHLNLGRGCQKCGGTSKNTKTDFISKALKEHDNFYNYDNVVYKTSKDKVSIICPIHGIFKQTPEKHLIGQGCTLCGINKRAVLFSSNVEDFILKANNLHGNIYNYANVNYKNAKTKVFITCSIHGDFLQTPNDHLSGYGCCKCGNLIQGYTATAFKERCIKNNNGLGMLYVIHCFNDTESFYKVGITSTGTGSRFKYSLPYDYDVIHEIQLDPIKVYNSENDILRSLNRYSYKPLLDFAGQTECFSNIEPIQQWLETNLIKTV